MPSPGQLGHYPRHKGRALERQTHGMDGAIAHSNRRLASIRQNRHYT